MRSATIYTLLGVVLSGCAPYAGLGHPPIPPIPPEQVLAPPLSSVALIWQPGHYDWTGTSYVFVAGRWVERAGHGTLWQDGFWQPTVSGSIWVPGHWI